MRGGGGGEHGASAACASAAGATASAALTSFETAFVLFFLAPALRIEAPRSTLALDQKQLRCLGREGGAGRRWGRSPERPKSATEASRCLKRSARWPLHRARGPRMAPREGSRVQADAEIQDGSRGLGRASRAQEPSARPRGGTTPSSQEHPQESRSDPNDAPTGAPPDEGHEGPEKLQ
eukprot:1669319-Pyramimonas_sp.AAC.1